MNPFYEDIRAILAKARTKAYHAINSTMVEAYWHMGKRIVEEEQHGFERAQHGSELINNLSVALGQEFGKGFSVANLKNFRKSILLFRRRKKATHCVAKSDGRMSGV